MTPKPKRRWFQYSLRSLLILVAVLCIGMNWFSNRMRRAERQRAAVKALGERYGTVLYDFQVDEEGVENPSAQLPQPEWLRNLLGDDFFRNVVIVHLNRSWDVSQPMKELAWLPALRELYFDQIKLTDDQLACLEDMSGLRVLFLDRTPLSDAGMVHLKGLSRMRHLDLTDTQITDTGLENLRGMSQLHGLFLSGNAITDAGLEKLTGLTQLQELRLFNTQVTKNGIANLKQSLPNCEIGGP